jgi:WD40 repeat protein
MSANSRWLAATTLAEPSKTMLWDLQAEDPKAKSVVLETSAALNLCTSRRWLVGGAQEDAEKIQVWDLNADNPWGKNVTVTKPKRAHLQALSPDGRWLFARHRDAADPSKDQVLVWDLKAATRAAKVLISHRWPSPPRAGDVSPDGRWLAITFDVEPNDVDLWDLQDNDPASRHSAFRGHTNTVRTLIFSPNSRWMVTGADDITARVWDLRAPKPAASCRVIPFNVEIATIAPNNRWLAMSNKRGLRLWDLDAADLAGTSVSLGDVDKGVGTLCITPDSRWLVTHGEEKKVRCWDLRSIKPKGGWLP